MIRALAILLICQLGGEALSRALDLPVPGPVVGLIILIFLLPVAVRLPQLRADVEKVADHILAALGLLFVPAGVGVIQQLGLLGTYWPAIIATLVLSTLLTMLVTVGTFLAVKKMVGAQ